LDYIAIEFLNKDKKYDLSIIVKQWRGTLIVNDAVLQLATIIPLIHILIFLQAKLFLNI
jgi:hypothetical protein